MGLFFNLDEVRAAPVKKKKKERSVSLGLIERPERNGSVCIAKIRNGETKYKLYMCKGS